MWFSAWRGACRCLLRRSLFLGSVTNALSTNARKTVSLPDFESICIPGAGGTTPNLMRAVTVTGRTGQSPELLRRLA
jgi:hypothetical protein